MIWAVVGLGLALVGESLALWWAWRTVRRLRQELTANARRIQAGFDLAARVSAIDQATQQELNDVSKETDKHSGSAADRFNDFFGK